MDAHLFVGQSNIAHLVENAASVPPPESGTFMWSPGGWVLPANAIVSFSNRLKMLTGKEVRTIQAAVGNSALLAESAASGSPLNYWLSRDPTSPLPKAIAMVLQSGANLRSIIWGQGERECESPQAVARMRAGYAEVHAALAGAAGKAPDELPFILCPTAHWATNFPVGGRRVIEAQQRASETIRGFVRGPDSWDLSTYDGGHLDAPSNIEFAQRIADKVAPIVGVAQTIVQGGGGSSSFQCNVVPFVVDTSPSANGAQAVNGVGFRPKLILFLAASSSNGPFFSIGFDMEGGPSECQYANANGNVGYFGQFSNGMCLYQSATNGNHFWNAYVSSRNSDGFVIQKSTTGNPSGPATVKAVCFG